MAPNPTNVTHLPTNLFTTGNYCSGTQPTIPQPSSPLSRRLSLLIHEYPKSCHFLSIYLLEIYGLGTPEDAKKVPRSPASAWIKTFCFHLSTLTIYLSAYLQSAIRAAARPTETVNRIGKSRERERAPPYESEARYLRRIHCFRQAKEG